MTEQLTQTNEEAVIMEWEDTTISFGDLYHAVSSIVQEYEDIYTVDELKDFLEQNPGNSFKLTTLKKV